MNILHTIKLMFSPEYRIEYGKKLWDELNKELPDAPGNRIQYEDRLKMFGEKTLLLTTNELKSLKLYLKRCLEETKIWEDEFISCIEEERLAKKKQFINDHLNVLYPKIDPPTHLL